jgi:predicted adenylyl cyclase CyaB
MKTQIGVKIRVDSFKKIRENLIAIGELIKSTKHVQEVFAPPKNNFFEPNEQLECLAQTEKQPLFHNEKVVCGQEQGYAEQYDTEIFNPDETKRMLSFLDFKKIRIIEKNREKWECGDFCVYLDEVKDLGKFVEIKVKNEFKNSKLTEQKCFQHLNKLGIENPEKKSITKDYSQMLLLEA